MTVLISLEFFVSEVSSWHLPSRTILKLWGALMVFLSFPPPFWTAYLHLPLHPLAPLLSRRRPSVDTVFMSMPMTSFVLVWLMLCAVCWIQDGPISEDWEKLRVLMVKCFVRTSWEENFFHECKFSVHLKYYFLFIIFPPLHLVF